MMTPCPVCGSDQIETFYEVPDVPVHSVLIHRSREDALAVPKGHLRLAACQRCQFVFNQTFDASLQDYDATYESTQHYSATFSQFAREQATEIIEKYDLRGKHILEIGCGQGEFIELLCLLGDNRGLGYDPAYRGLPIRLDGRLQFIAEDYSGQDAAADFVCCKMTLEHIAHPAEFLSMIRGSVSPQAVIFFQIPNAEAVFQQLAFWDIYYEHCAYFSRASLRYLFQSTGFRILDLKATYSDQYLVVEALPAAPQDPVIPRDESDTARNGIRHFRDNIGGTLEKWRQAMQQMRGQRVVLWGGGSKAVALLTSLNLRDEVAYIIDINPNKHQTFLARTGHAVMNPSYLAELPPDVIIVMNPLYRDEVEKTARQYIADCRIATVEDL